MAKRRYTQNFASLPDSEDDKLVIHYCLHCGSYALILDTALSSLPRRRTDNSYVLEDKKILKNNMLPADVKVVKRPNGLERQYRLNCSECGLFVGYRPVDFTEETRFVYVLPEALGTRQDLTLGLKHHTLAELKGQLATLLARHPTGVHLSHLRALFKQHFNQDLDERDYGDFKNLEGVIRSLNDIATVGKTKEASGDLLVLPVPPSAASNKRPRTAENDDSSTTTTTTTTTTTSSSK